MQDQSPPQVHEYDTWPPTSVLQTDCTGSPAPPFSVRQSQSAVRSLQFLPRSLRPPRCAALSAQDFKYETMKHRHPLAVECMRDLRGSGRVMRFKYETMKHRHPLAVECMRDLRGSGRVMRYMFTCIANIFTMSACYTRLCRSKLVSLPFRAPDMPQVCTLASRGPCPIQSYELIGATSTASCM
jgi:hypothetical protein